MALKIPIRGDYDNANNVIGLAEFQSGEAISILHGGTGLVSLTPSSLLVGLNSDSMTQVHVPDNHLVIGGLVGGIQSIKATDTIDCGTIAGG